MGEEDINLVILNWLMGCPTVKPIGILIRLYSISNANKWLW